ncbi:hypothetical protein HRI_002882200 [Hibiscus trionum]|uniref:Helicase protein MOM1-like n=1 Tax=Hibiscus trionum TaxID=183268 RepID=A0A9W7IAY9_HIBTR|nr:hypothetical protein HRI_002882200 [Hibiscus trionum]
MANGTRSSSRKAKDDENNDLKGSENSGKKSVNSGAATAEASGVRRSPRETLSKENMTPPSSSGMQKLELLEKQTANLNSMTPDKRKSEHVEMKKRKNTSPSRRLERGEMSSSSSSSGSKRSDKSLDVLNTKRKKEKKEKMRMQPVEVNKIEEEDEQEDETQKKRRDARSYRAFFTKQPKKVDGTDRCNDLNGTNSGRKEENLLKEFTERTHERTTVTSTSQFAKEELKRNNEHKLFPTSQKNSCRDISSNGGDPQLTKNGLVAGETNDAAETATLKNLQSPQMVNPIVPGGVHDCDISMEMVPKVAPSERKGHGIDIDSVASPKMSSNGIDTCSGVGTSLSPRCKRKDCTATCGMCSERQRVDCNSTKQEICSSNMKLNQFFGSSDIKDRGKLDAGISTGHIEKPCNHIQQHIPSADLQTGCCQNTCIICGLDGKLLCCRGKGCKRHYHLSCLEPPLEEFPLGAWYCLECVWKKIESGIYSVSEGIEAILDSKELEASDDGLQRQKEYFVKYKGLAHVHNRWVPENQVLLQAPSLIAKYNRKNQGAVWKHQWAVPHRLLLKRLLTTPKECDELRNKELDVDKLNCHVEWLVKWCGLGYEHASWELENASFFSYPEGQRLIREYETRKKIQRASKFDKERAVASLKISHLPAAVSSRLDANLDAVNKLCNHWRRGQNAIIFDDHERICNVISSILAFSSEVSRPFLIISSSASQYAWDEEFLHLAPSVDVVVYSGSKEIRNSIRNLEFYDEGSRIMFQVLITSPEVISEDLNVLDCIGWEAIIVDECQRPRIGSCFEQIKMLTASKRLLIISNQLKDNASEYLNLLSLLDSQSEPNNSELTNSSNSIDTLKERLAMFVAYECKLESSRFLEYWVPVLLSNVQLEKYCFTLVSNSLSLCSPSKTDPVGVLRSILVSSRKCCDHPYDVDQSLQTLLTKGLQAVEFLEVGIKASGKLQLLDAMLSEIKKRELKVIILFQYIGGSGRDLMGDILDDFLRQRFGIDSYERVNNGVIPSKKQSALNRFNNERERFVLLLETRACLSSVKLSAVGTVIIFGSDWSPVNDLRALQRLTLDSQFEQIKVFRLYSSFTVEEKLLILSKQEKTIDSNIENISPSSSHMLLKWGASYLFSELEKFHDISTQDASTLSQQSHIKDAIREFSTILHQTGIDNTSKLSLILQAKQNQGTYWTEMPLFGEQKIQVMNGDPPHTFWTQLLEGKLPRWKYCTSTSQRNRKRVQYFDELQKEPEVGSAEVAKKRKKFVSDANNHPSPKAVQQGGELATGDREGISETLAYDFTTLSRSIASERDKINATSTSLHQASSISKIPALIMVDWESRKKQCDLQKNLHVLLRPQIAKLCEVLHLEEDVKAMVERFLEYIMNNHLVNREPATILQAFQISLCWSAAALLKQKLDHKESLALAKQHLGFTCKKEEADYVYSLLRCLKIMFLYRTGYLKVLNSPKASGLSSKAVERDYSNATPYRQNIKAKVEDLSGFREGSDIQTISESGVAPEIQLAQREVLKSIKEIQKKFDKKMKKQIEKHKQEMEQFKQKYEEEKAQLENKKRTEAAVIRLHSNVSMRTDKLNNLIAEYARKFDELEQKMVTDLKNLEASHVAAKSNILERQTGWVESVKSWARVELVKSPVSEVNLSEARCSGNFQSASGSEVRPSKIVHILDDEAVAYSNPINKAGPFKQNTEGASVECNLTANSGCVEEQAVSRDSCLREQDSIDEIPKGGVLEEVLSMRCSDEEQISDGSKANMSDCETVSLTDVLENLDPMEAPSFLAPSSEIFSDKSTLRKVDGETLRETVTIISSEGLENFVSLETSSSVAIHDESYLSKVDGPVPLREPVVANSGEGQEKLISAEALSSEIIPNGAALNNFDGEVHLGAPKTDSSGEGYESSPSFLVPSSEEVPSGTTLNTVNSELPLGRPEAICSTEAQGNIMSANCSLEKQIPGEATLNVPDAEIPKSMSEIATSCDGTDIIACTKSSASKEQIPDTAACSMPAKEVPLAEPETAPSEVLNGGNVRRENDGTSPNENDQQDGVVCTVNRESELREPSSDLVSTNVDSLPCASSEVQASCLANSEMQNASQAAEISPFDGAIDETCNVSNPDVTVVELTEQVQQLRSSESTSNLSPPDLPSVSAVEPPLNNEGQSSQAPRQLVANHIDGVIDGLVRQASETRTTPIPSNASQAAEISPFNGAIDETCNVSNPDVTVVELTEQVQQLRSSESTSNLSPPDLPSVSAVEHLSNNEGQTSNQSSQAPRQPVANHINGVIDGLVRQASETRTAPIPSVSDGFPLQTTPAVSSRMPDDPLKIEIERIKKEKEQTTKIHEHTKLQLKLECDKEMEEVVAQIRRKYEVKLLEKEAEFLLQKKELDVYYDKVLLNKNLAEAFKSKCIDNRSSCSAGAMPEANSSFLQQQLQLSSQQVVQQPSTASGLPSTASASSMPTVSSAAVVNLHAMSPPFQVVNPSALFSSTPTRPPYISTISSSTGNPQIGTEIRAPAPHLQPFRPSSSISQSSLPLHSGGMSSQQAHNSNPAASMSLHSGGMSSQQAHNSNPAASMSLHQPYVNPLAHRQSSTTGQSGRIQHEIARGLTAPPNSRLRSLDVLMGVNNPSGANANPPGFLLPDSSSRSAMRSHRESRVLSSQSNTAQQRGGAIDIVCLSDDD